jgi:hypothetical protein
MTPREAARVNWADDAGPQAFSLEASRSRASLGGLAAGSSFAVGEHGCCQSLATTCGVGFPGGQSGGSQKHSTKLAPEPSAAFCRVTVATRIKHDHMSKLLSKVIDKNCPSPPFCSLSCSWFHSLQNKAHCPLSPATSLCPSLALAY